MFHATLASEVRDWTQTGLASVVGVITILTYRRARDTILQPLRTEVFKVQLEAARSLLGELAHKSNSELGALTGFEECVRLNSDVLVAREFQRRGWTSEVNAFELLRKEIAGGMSTMEGMSRPDGSSAITAGEKPAGKELLPDPRDGTLLGAASIEWITHARQIERNPFLPANAIEKFKMLNGDSRAAISAIREVSELLGERLIALDDLSQLDVATVRSAFHNECLDRCPDLQARANEVVVELEVVFGFGAHRSLWGARRGSR